MSIVDVRRKAQEKTHRHFGVSATFRRTGYSDIPNVKVRLHQQPILQGDLDREGYAQSHEMGSVIIFWKSDYPEVVNGCYWLLEDGRMFQVANILPRFDTYRGFAEVVELQEDNDYYIAG